MAVGNLRILEKVAVAFLTELDGPIGLDAG